MFRKYIRAGACSALENRLEDYVEGRLPDGQIAEVDAHVRGCARCAAALERARASVDLLSAVKNTPLPAASPFFVSRVMASIGRERGNQEIWRPLEIAGWELCWLAALAALILAVFMLRIERAAPRLPVGGTVQQSQVQELIDVPVSQPAVQDDALLVAASNANGR